MRCGEPGSVRNAAVPEISDGFRARWRTGSQQVKKGSIQRNTTIGPLISRVPLVCPYLGIRQFR
jgi:hypothetical protein